MKIKSVTEAMSKDTQEKMEYIYLINLVIGGLPMMMFGVF